MSESCLLRCSSGISGWYAVHNSHLLDTLFTVFGCNRIVQLAASIHHLFPDDVINDPTKGCYAKLLPTRKSCPKHSLCSLNNFTNQDSIFLFWYRLFPPCCNAEHKFGSYMAQWNLFFRVVNLHYTCKLICSRTFAPRAIA